MRVRVYTAMKTKGDAREVKWIEACNGKNIRRKTREEKYAQNTSLRFIPVTTGYAL